MDEGQMREAWDAATEAEVRSVTADPDTVLAVSGMCDRFADELADVIVARFPSLDRESVKATCSIDAWLLASDMTEWSAMEARQ